MADFWTNSQPKILYIFSWQFYVSIIKISFGKTRQFPLNLDLFALGFLRLLYSIQCVKTFCAVTVAVLAAYKLFNNLHLIFFCIFNVVSQICINYGRCLWSHTASYKRSGKATSAIAVVIKLHKPFSLKIFII